MDLHLKDVQFVIGTEGKPTAVLVGIAAWERILNALEDAEDIALARQALSDLDAAGGDMEKAGFVSWQDARAELERLDDALF